MVAIINITKSISNTLNYNEQKLRHQTAELLIASGFIKRAEKLNYSDKLRQFHRYTSLNDRTLCNTLHITLNFDRSDDLNNEKFSAIAVQYMEAIGFGLQPFLVYRHYDSAHPHVHIVTINIQKDGSRIPVHFLWIQSWKANREIESLFGLKKAQKHNHGIFHGAFPAIAQKVIYGKHPTHQSVSHVLQEVIGQYRFSSFPEFNAILKLFNVVADRGGKNSNMFKWKGLIYRVLDDTGRPIGTPIRASRFGHKPTVALLERKFMENELLKQGADKHVMAEIEFALAKSKKRSLSFFVEELERGRICAVLQKNKETEINGIIYVDFKTKTVFNGTDLGKEYDAEGILNRLGLGGRIQHLLVEKELVHTSQKNSSGESYHPKEKSWMTSDQLFGAIGIKSKPISRSV